MNERKSHYIFGTGDCVPNGKVRKIDDYVYEVDTPYELMTSHNPDKLIKFIRVQCSCDAGMRPKDITVHCDLISSHSQMNYSICPANVTFHNRLEFPINNPPSKFHVFFTDGYGLPVIVLAWTAYTNITY
jgi:hypothetical protein